MEAKYVPAFFDFSPGQCIFPAKTRGYARCRNTIGTTETRNASELRSRILSMFSADQPVLKTLDDYAYTCCCQRWHRGFILRPGVLHAVADRWAAELEDRPSPKLCRQTGVRRRQKTGQVSRQLALPPALKPAAYPTTTSASHSPTASSFSSQSSRATSPTSVEAPWAGFIPYQSTARLSLIDTLSTRVTKSDHRSGWVYCYTRDSDPEMVKIGYTAVSVESRMTSWQMTCHYTPRLQCTSIYAPHVKRLERLVHLEMAEHRRREINCRHNRDCMVSHQEWFEVEVSTARAVIHRWAHWLVQAMPYDDDTGNLKDEWREVCSWLNSEGKPVNSTTLLWEMEDMVARKRASSARASCHAQGQVRQDMDVEEMVGEAAQGQPVNFVELSVTSGRESESSIYGQADTSTPDALPPDISTPDTSTPDTSTPDTSTPDTSTPDTSTPDTFTPDTSTPDTSTPDTSTPDTFTPDTFTPDTFTPNNQTPVFTPTESTASTFSDLETSSPNTSTVPDVPRPTTSTLAAFHPSRPPPPPPPPNLSIALVYLLGWFIWVSSTSTSSFLLVLFIFTLMKACHFPPLNAHYTTASTSASFICYMEVRL